MQDPEVGTAFEFGEQQGSQCGWRRVNHGKNNLDEVREFMKK